MGEWKRLINARMLLIIGVVIVANLLLFGYEQINGKSLNEFTFEQEQRRWITDYYGKKSLEEALKHIIAVNTRISSELSGQANNDNLQSDEVYQQIREDVYSTNKNETELVDEKQFEEVLTYNRGLSLEQQTCFYAQLKEIQAKLKALNEYHTNVVQVIQNADKLHRFSVFADTASYSYVNIMQTGKDHERVENLEVSLTNDKAVEQFLSFSYVYYLGLALMVLLVYNIFKERENGMWIQVHGVAKGRAGLACQRIITLAGSSLGIFTLLYGSTLIESFLLYGCDGLDMPVQNLGAFSGFTYAVSQGQYLVWLFFISWLAIFSLSVFFWMMFVIFRNRNHALLATGFLIGGEALIYEKISVQSIYGLLRQINLVRVLNMNEILRVYENWNVGGRAVAVWKIMVVALVAIMILSGALAVTGTIRMRPEGKTSILSRILGKISQSYQKVFQNAPMLLKEFHKLVITSKGTWIIIVVIILAVYFTGTGVMNFTSGMKEKDQIYLEHGGKDCSYVEELVQTRKDEYQEVCVKLKMLFESYHEGDTSLEELVNASSQVAQYASRLKSIEEFDQKLEYLEQMKTDYGVSGYLISDRGYEEIFGKYGSQRELILLLIMIAGIMLVISESVIMEYRTGMEYILRSAKNGRMGLLKRKLAACMILTILVFLLVYGIDLIMLTQLYGMPYLEAPLMSLTFMEGVSTTFTIADWIGLRLLIRLGIGIVSMIVAFITSRIIGRKGNRGFALLLIVVVLAAVMLMNKWGWLL